VRALRYNVRVLLVVTTVVALSVLAAKPLVINYVYPWFLQSNVENLLDALLVLAVWVFVPIHAAYFYLRCRSGVNRSTDQAVGPPLQLEPVLWGTGQKLGLAGLFLYVLVGAIGRATKGSPPPTLAIPAQSFTSIAVFGLLNAAVSGWMISYVLVVPHIRCRFLAFLTEEHFDYPGGPLLPWASLRSFTWQDRKQGHLRMVFPSNYYISSLRLIVPEDDIEFVDDFLRTKLNRSE